MDQQEKHSAAGDVVRGLAGAALLMVFATFGSRVTGMIRTMVLAHVFGTTGEINAFYQAFVLPDFVYFLIAGGALKTGFVPVFTEFMAHGREDRAWRTFSVCFWVLTIFASLLVIAGMVFAPVLATVIAPGWRPGGQEPNPELLESCGQYMRVLFPAQLFFVLGGLLQGALNARKHFLWPGMGPIVYNLFIIGGAFLAPHMGGIATLTYAVVLGALVGNVLIQIPVLGRYGARLMMVFDLHDEGLRRVVRLALPIIFGLAIAEINWMIVKALATMTGGDAPAILETANRLWKLPAGIFGAGIAIALFPTLSEHYSLGNHQAFRRDFSFGVRNTLFLVIPTAIVMGVMRLPVVRLLFERGAFTPESSAAVAEVLFWLTPGMVALAVLYIVARTFYARQNTVTPLAVGLVSIGVCVAGAFPLMNAFGLPGLAMATSLSGVVNAGILMYILKVRAGLLDGHRILVSQLRCVPANAFLAAVCWWAPPLLEAHLGTGEMGKLLTVLLSLGLGLAGFTLLAALTRVEELRSAWRLVSRRRRNKSGPVETDRTNNLP